MVTLCLCDFCITGGHHFGTQIEHRHLRIEAVQARQAKLDGDFIMPKISVHARKGFANEFANLNNSLPKQDQITPSLEIAQAALESNWGTSVLFKKANNPWGVKGEFHGKYLDYETTEYNSKGQKYTEMSRWKDYPTLADAVEDHNKLLINKFLKGSQPNNYVSEAKALKRNRYATDPYYAQKIMYEVQHNDLTRFD